MKLHHTSWYWVVVAAVLAVALFTLGEAHGQSVGANAMFEGRPAMAGAQAGQGPMAGPPQGGLAPQSTEDLRGALAMGRRPNQNAGPEIPRDPGVDNPAGGELKPQRDRDSGEVIQRDRDRNGLSDQGSAAGKAKRAARRSAERSRRGVPAFDN